MKIVGIIGRPGSKSVSQIVKKSSITRYSAKCDLVINYGLAGDRLEEYNRNHGSIIGKKILNHYVGRTKYAAIKDAEDSGVRVPKTYLKLPAGADPKKYLSKKMHSQGGVGIVRATGKENSKGRYYQEFISDRKFELRVHAFSWIPEHEWEVQKRLGSSDVIAWNFHNGGRFQTVRNPEGYKVFTEAQRVAKKILSIRKMDFGAVDFVVTSNMSLYFLEINSAPGFTELSEHIYINAFNLLTK